MISTNIWDVSPLTTESPSQNIPNHPQISVSLDPFVAFPLAIAFQQAGIKIKREPNLPTLDTSKRERLHDLGGAAGFVEKQEMVKSGDLTIIAAGEDLGGRSKL